MSQQEIPEYKGRGRPEMSTDRLGYPPEDGDREWKDKHKKNYRKLPNGNWVRK